ncbi:alpha/beta fold hydrolase [Nonomuraea sediminis]|uniref:alpha/beta fold hydrolase n=1 Tax=Nonomuraea sediminis TaxID=2835864 RepID=UPI001BDD2F4B|nr:alpha/beta hydrolase [Nonomuraea sediminis]
MTIWHDSYGSGEAVVLLHSSAADSEMWDPQVEALSDRFRVIRADSRGYGRSPLVPGVRYSDAEDVEAVLAELGVRRAALVGSSYGCRVALELASGDAVEATRLVLLNPAIEAPLTPDAKQLFIEEEELVTSGDLDGASELVARALLGPSAASATRRHLVEMQRNAYELQLAADPEPTQVAREVRPAELDLPALVVFGGRDLEYFRRGAEHLAAELPRAELMELEWAGHLPSLERPEEITALLLDYL